MFAELGELQARWRTLTPAEAGKAQTLLGDASRMVTRFYPTVPARLAADADFAKDVAMVVCNMVKRAMEPDARAGVISETDTRGPFAISRRYSNPDGDLDFTVREEAILAGTPVTAGGALPIWTGDVPA